MLTPYTKKANITSVEANNSNSKDVVDNDASKVDNGIRKDIGVNGEDKNGHSAASEKSKNDINDSK